METCKQPASPDGREGIRGFTIIEMLIVAMIILILAAVMAPNIGQYIRNFKIRGEANNIATNLQKARNRAIMKNANLGVSVVIENPTTYWVHLEDDQIDVTDMSRDVNRQPLNVAAPDATQSTRFRLANDVRFAINAAQCPTAPGGFVPDTDRLRFNRLGSWCNPGFGCPDVPGPGGPPFPDLLPFSADRFIRVNATGGLLCVNEANTGLSRWIAISAGGRIAAQQ